MEGIGINIDEDFINKQRSIQDLCKNIPQEERYILTDMANHNLNYVGQNLMNIAQEIEPIRFLRNYYDMIMHILNCVTDDLKIINGDYIENNTYDNIQMCNLFYTQAMNELHDDLFKGPLEEDDQQ